MGIVNVTPDSFSDGGEFSDPQRAVEAALRMEAAGADIIDIGGESTRPYSDPVDAAEERQRVVPVIRSLVGQLRIPISVDTSKASVARAALAAGAEIINDVTGLEGDAEMLEVALESRAGVCVMHMRGTPQTMQDDPRYDDVVGEIHDYLRQRLQWCIEAGLDRARICLDPGIGFGKTHEHNQQLLQQVARFLDLEVPLLVGHSRKGFIAKAIGDKNADRTAGTLGVSLALALRGVHILRVHDVAFTVQGLRSFDYAGGFA
jgi:dihydropteroate synthase